MRIKIATTTAFVATVWIGALNPASAAHLLHESQSLAGEWEMAYRAEAWKESRMPEFFGAAVEKAVPGYWEDMVPAFRAAGIRDEFKINPDHVEQSFPMTGWAKDTTLPNISGCFLYRRRFVPLRTGPALLYFDCVRNQVHAWVNGKFIAFRQGFSTPFELAIPDGVLKSGTNEIVLAVANVPNAGYGGREVSGLTTRSIYGSTGGIDGRLEVRYPASDISDAYITTAADLKTFTIHVRGRDRYRYEVSEGGRVLASGEATGDVALPVDGFKFWSPESPKLYRLTLTAGGRSFSQQFGLRRLAAVGEKLFLHGEPVYLRGVTEHGYFAQTVLVPRNLEYWRMVARRRKELGFNFVRFHTFVPPEEYLDATDELGMLVHVETPNFVTLDEYEAVVAFARRHSSVVIYCTGNETRIDGGAEKYLEDVAKIVHRETDALFTPMSALRGVEYFIVKGEDDYVEKPLPHNAGRIGRMVRYSDLFTSYQLGVASYCSLNKGSPAVLDEWGDAYCGKPRLSHEICIDSSYVDFSTEALYPPDSPILVAGVFSRLREYLKSRGVYEKSDLYFRNSCEWMRRIRKFTFEKLRAADRVAGFDFLGDINTHWHTFGYSVGMMDEFYRLKPGETPEDVRRYNSAAVLLTDLGSDFNVKAGEVKRVKLSVSNYARAVKDGQLRVSLVACPEGNGFTAKTQSRKEVWRSEKHIGDVPNGKVSALCEVEVGVPASEAPKKYVLRASVAGLAENEWEVYAFPAATAANPPGVRVMADATEDELVRAMEAGDRVLLLGAGPFNSLPTTYRIGMAGRTSGNYATVVKDHPALRNFPHDGFCGWQFRRLFEDGRAVQLEAGVPFDPIIDVASSVKCVIRQSVLFEYRVGKGRLLVCSLNFGGDDPAAAWLKKCLVEYASSDEFKPAQELSAVQLHAVLAEPLISADENTNFAKNANDPASVIDYEPPPAPGPESWTFRDDLAKPAAYHAREAYVLDDGYGLEGALSTVKADLARFFASAGKPPKRTLRLRRAKVAGGESYRIDIADDGSATLSAEDDDGMRRGVYYFEDRVSAGDLKPVTRRPWLRHRISRCYFSPIKRPPFNRDELMDDIDYYPDEYLNRLAHEGVNGLWLTITLGDIVETSFNRRDKDAPRRIAKLRRTIEKCARYGIRVWPFCIEPRFMMPDNPIVKEHPEMMSTQKSYFGSSLVCPSTEEGRRYIEEAVADLFRQLPGIPGILNLSHGERPTTCLSQVDPLFDAPSACSRCRSLPPAEIHRLAAQSFVNGMRRVNPKAEYLSWLYHPHVRNERGDWVADVPRRLPDGATVLYNFESGALKDQLGRYRAGGDYWLSYVGPSTAFRRVADSARGAGARLGAKIQVGCSHECATVPFVPAPGLLYRKYRAMRTAGCSAVMQCWYFGNYPGIMNKAAGELAFSDFAEDERGFLERLAAPEWGEDAKTMAGVWRDLTDAYSEYPLSNDMQYYGPFHAGVAWPLYARVEMKPLGRTWKPQDVTSGDAIGECLENHTLEEAAMLAFRMRRGVAGLAPTLNRLSAKYAGDRDRLLDLGVAKALALLFESASDVFDFYLHRARAVSASRLHGDSETALGELALMRTAARDAMRTTEEMLPLARADARLGFHSEAENHQFHPAKLEWRLAMLRQTLADIDEIEAALRRGEPYPKSEHEAKAPTMRCGEWTETSRAFKAIRRTNSELDLLLDGTWAPTDRHFRFRPSFADNGDFVLEGEIPGPGPIEVLTLDACGATWSRTLKFGVDGKVSHPSHNVVTTTHEVRSLTTATKGGGWTFRLVLDASGWGGDMAKRPSWLLVRSGGGPIWPELNPAPEARLNIGNVTPDLFGRIEAPAPAHTCEQGMK
ncbi:MAG: hypothetical protein IJG13_00425 [Kiritimatiellae bacterium]|nr:hypothetical protein [Kiritimatiellia bacterium]